MAGDVLAQAPAAPAYFRILKGGRETTCRRDLFRLWRQRELQTFRLEHDRPSKQGLLANVRICFSCEAAQGHPLGDVRLSCTGAAQGCTE